MRKQPDDYDEELYQQAEDLLADNAEALRLCAILAYEHRSSQRDLRQLSFQWQRDSKRMAAAVSRWPDYFFTTNGMPPKIVEVDDALTLFALAAIPEAEATMILEDVQTHSLRSWQVKARLDVLAEQKAVAAGEVPRLKSHATVREIGAHTVILGWESPQPDGLKLEDVWRGQRVRVSLVLDEA